MLEHIADHIWLANGKCVDFYGFPYPTRCVIVRLKNKSLWVWSPIALDDDLQAAVKVLGPVAHLVSPNKIHHLFLKDWAKVWPNAKIWGPASTQKKRRDLHFEPPLNDEAPPDWAGEIDQFWFRGSFFLDEIVFFHRASQTAILADLSENFDMTFLKAHWKPWQIWIAKLWKITEPWGYAPLEWRLSFLTRTLARKARAGLLKAAPKRVIMAHGHWIKREGTAYLKRALAWL